MRTKIRKQIDRIKSEPGLKKNVTVLGVLVVLALGAGGFILGNQGFTGPWTDQYELNAEFEAAPGISPGNGQEVRIHGVIVGRITGADVNDEGRAELQMKLEPGHKIYDNASLVLRPKSPLNEMYVTIDPGSPDGGTLVKSGATLPVGNTQRPVQIDEVLGQLDDDARGALTALLNESDDALASAPSKLPAGVDGLNEVVTDLGPVARELDTRRETLQRLVAAVSDISGAVGENDKRLIDLAGSLDTTLQAIADEKGPLSEGLGQLEPLVKQLDSSTAAVAALSNSLDPTLRDVQSASNDLPKALERVADTAETLSDTVDVARPVVDQAKPVVADLRPYVGDLRDSLPVFERTTARLDPVTGLLTKYLPDVGAFMVNTRSVTSMHDGNGGILRGMLVVSPGSLPTDVLENLLTPEKVDGPLG